MGANLISHGPLIDQLNGIEATWQSKHRQLCNGAERLTNLCQQAWQYNLLMTKQYNPLLPSSTTRR